MLLWNETRHLHHHHQLPPDNSPSPRRSSSVSICFERMRVKEKRKLLITPVLANCFSVDNCFADHEFGPPAVCARRIRKGTSPPIFLLPECDVNWRAVL